MKPVSAPCLPIAILAGVLPLASATPASLVTAPELAEAAEWVAAKFAGTLRPQQARPGLLVVANHDPVQKNSRAGKPLQLGTTQYTRGLYCHAFSTIQVRLPAPGKSFTAIVGVDSNEQTSGGRGSVEFAIRLGEQEPFRSGILREGMPARPVHVSLNGATEFTLLAEATPDGITCDQADWAEAKATLQDGREVWLADLPLFEHQRAPHTTNAPFAFSYDSQPSDVCLASWPLRRQAIQLDAQRTEHTLTWTDLQTGLQVRCRAIQYHDFPTVEWTVFFQNTGTNDTPVLADIQALDTHFERGGSGDFVLHHHKGTFVRADDFEPLTTPLQPGRKERLAPPAGRPCGQVWPYFNLEWPGQGVIIVVGWPGQWAAAFAPGPAGNCRVVAGQELTRLKLRPGEMVRTPLIVLQFWRGDWLRAQNIWRRWMLAHALPRPGGKLPEPLLTPCSSHQFAEMVQADETNQKLFIDRYLEEELRPDYWWMDAGWYLNQSGWPNTGTWLVDSNRFPHGLRAISNYAHSQNIKTLLWFEPERVTPGTWLHQQHPEWLLQGTLLNLGNSNAWRWLVEHIDKTLVEQGIDLYRQDFNIDPLKFWRENDAFDRQGITENHYVTGYLAYWDELRRRHPDMLIDSCASGGHRNDLETLRRALPFLRSDFIQDAIGNQAHTYGLSFWLPYCGTGTDQTSDYELRSAMAGPHFIACWDMRNRQLDYERLRRQVHAWRQYAPNYFGDYYPLTPYSLARDIWMGWQFDQPERGEGLVQVFRREQSSYESARFKLRGLDPVARYTVVNLDNPDTLQEFTGQELRDKGLLVSIPALPGAVLLKYHRH